VTKTSGEPNWIAYIGVQILLGPKDAQDNGDAPTPR
jgi:hypothetical protein